MHGTMALAMAPRDLTNLELRARIAGWLEDYRRSNSLSQADLARAMGKPEGTVSRILKGKRGIGLDILWIMRSRLHINFNQMFDFPAPQWPAERPLRPVDSGKGDQPEVSSLIPSRPHAARSGSVR